MVGFGRLTSLCASGGFFAFSSALAANPLYTLGIRGEVPVVCRAELQAAPVAGASGELSARLHEFCNSGAGYSVYAVASDPNLRVSVDGRPLEVQADGRYLLSSAMQPAITSRAVTLAGPPGGTLRITVVAA